MRPEDLVQLLSQIDANKPDARDALGRRMFNIRCAVPFTFDCGALGMRIERPEDAQQRDRNPQQRAEVPTSGKERIIGPASSTSQDWYGTRMVKTCLEDMAEQFKRGVDYLPRHHSWIQAVEWYEQIGRTVDAELRRGEVKNPPEGESATEQWILYTHTDLWMRKEIARELVENIEDGNPPGQSIGGWFREIQVTYDDDGYVVYPINILRVELDHLAAVRSPANPDADRVWLALSTKLGELGASLRSSEEVPARSTPPPESSAAPVEPSSLESRSAPIPSPDGSIPGTTDASRVEQAATPAIPDSGDVVGTANPSSDAEASPPSPSSDASGRASEVEMTEEQLRALLGEFTETLRGEIGELRNRVDAVAGGNAPAPELTPEQRLAAAEERVRQAEAARIAAEQRAQAAEQMLNAGGGSRSGQRGQGGGAPSGTGNGGQPEVPELFRGPDGRTDMRSIAPGACKLVARSGGEIDLSPALVLRHDGIKPLAQYAQVQGTSKRLAQFCLDNEDLHERNVFSRSGKLRRREESELRDMLSEIIWHGCQDGLIASGTQNTSWA